MDPETMEQSVFEQLMQAALSFVPEGKTKFKKQNLTETDAAFLARLLEHMSELPKEQYDQLPEDTVQSWFNAAADAFNESQPIPVPDGFESRNVPKDKIRRETARKQAAAKGVAPAIRKRGSGHTIGRTIRMALIQDQSLNFDALRVKLAEAGFPEVKVQTLSTLSSGTIATLRVAAELGRFTLNPPLDVKADAA